MVRAAGVLAPCWFTLDILPSKPCCAVLRCVRLSLLLCLMCLLAGCAAPLPYRPAPLDLPAARASFALRNLDDAGLLGFMRSAGVTPPAAGEAWTCSGLALAGAWFSPALAVAQARWAQALAQQTLSLQPAGGTLDALLEHHGQTDPVRSSPWSVALGFEFTLPSPARRAALTAATAAGVREARLALAETTWQVQQSVRTQCVQVQVAQARLALLQQRTAVLQALQGATLQQVALGLRSAVDLRAAARQLDEARQQAAQGEAELAASQNALRGALALPPASLAARQPLKVAPLPAHFAVPDAAEAQRQALANRLDLQQAEARFLRADAALQLVVARQFPELSLHPGYEWDQGDHRLRIGLALPVTLPNAHPAAVAAAETERTVLAQEALGLQEAVLQGTLQAHAALVQAEHLRMLQSAQRAALAGQLQSAQAALRLGALDQQDVRAAELDVLQGERQSLDLQAASALAWLQLQDVLHLPMETAE